MLQSPFPGMDPYLEINPRWQVFHGSGWIRYGEELVPEPPLSAEDQAWVKRIVNAAS